MPYAQSNGVELFYELKGAGQPVVFVHGIPTDRRAWAAQVKALASDFQTLTYSRRMAAPNRNGEDYDKSTVENNSDDLIGLVHSLGISPVHLVGHSHGGLVAAYAAGKSPEMIRTLTLVDPAISTILVKDRKNPFDLLALLLRSPRVALSARRFQSGSLNPSLAALGRGEYDAALRLNLDGIMGRSGAYESFPDETREMMKENERTIGELGLDPPQFGREEASRLAMPALLVNGAGSPRFFHAINQRLARSMPRSRRVRIPASAHFPHLENAREFNLALVSFLRGSG